ncbi:MAG: hypothetical protein JWM80_5227, partial [Cyanobacteria bacterium RYN_339]|nr:hypothetical protein [Cyanobacteria bacterium RYN_339]
MLHRSKIPALVLAACVSTLVGCPATPNTVKPTTHKSADPVTPPGTDPTTTTTTTTTVRSTDNPVDAIKHAYFGKVLGADGKGVVGVSIKAYIVANNAGSLVTDNGSGLVTDNGSGMIANNAGNILASGGGSIISTDGASTKARRLLAADPTTTDANGEFKLEIPEGQTFNVEAVQSDSSKAFAQTVTSKTASLDLTLAPTGSIHGKVAYPDDPKVTDFTGVDVFIPGSSYLAKTAADGSFTISNVPVGSFSLFATKRGLGGGHVDAVKVEAKGVGEVPQLPLKLLPLKLKTLSATSGAPGMVLTMDGDYFGAEQGLPFQVRMGGAVLEGAKRDAKGQITVTLADSARSGDVVVEVDGHASNPLHFDVITGFSIMVPSVLEPGTSTTIAATGTDPDKKSVTNLALTWKIAAGTAATVDAKGTITAGATPGTVTVQANAGALTASFKLVVGKAGAVGVGGRVDAKLFGLKDLAFAPDGRTLYLACQNAILAYDLAADITSVFAGSTAGGKPEDREGAGEEARFSGILGLAADPQGNLVALESTCLVAIDKDRHVTIAAGKGKDPSVKSTEDFFTAKDGTGDQVVFEGPLACAFGKDGKLIFTDGQSLRTLVGNTVAHVDGSKDAVSVADSLCVDKAGVPWVLDFDGLTPFGPGATKIPFPEADLETGGNVEIWDGLVRDANGTFYASGDGRIYRFKADGSRTVLAGGDVAALLDG